MVGRCLREGLQVTINGHQNGFSPSSAIGLSLRTLHAGPRRIKAHRKCFPLLSDEPKVVRLEIKVEDKWILINDQPVQYPGWSVHFRVDDWDASKNVPYRKLRRSI